MRFLERIDAVDKVVKEDLYGGEVVFEQIFKEINKKYLISSP